MTISAYTIFPKSFVSDSADDGNDPKKRKPIYSGVKKVPVMRSDERRHTEDLLAFAMKDLQSSKRLARKPSLPVSLKQSIDREDLGKPPADRNSNGFDPSDVKVQDSQTPAFGVPSMQKMPKPQNNLADLPAQLAVIESSLIGGERKVSRIEIQEYLDDISRQLTKSDPPHSFSDLLTPILREELMFRLEFIEGYFEASSNDGDSNRSIAQSLQNLLNQVDEAYLKCLPTSPTVQLAESLSAASNMVSEKISTEATQGRRRQGEIESSEFSDRLVGDKLTSPLNKAKKISLDRKQIQAASAEKQQVHENDIDKDNDKKRDETLPLVTLRSV